MARVSVVLPVVVCSWQRLAPLCCQSPTTNHPLSVSLCLSSLWRHALPSPPCPSPLPSSRLSRPLRCPGSDHQPGSVGGEGGGGGERVPRLDHGGRAGLCHDPCTGARFIVGGKVKKSFFFRRTRGSKRRAQIKSDLISSHRELLPPLDIRRISRTSHITKVYLTSFLKMKMVINMLMRVYAL